MTSSEGSYVKGRDHEPSLTSYDAFEPRDWRETTAARSNRHNGAKRSSVTLAMVGPLFSRVDQGGWTFVASVINCRLLDY